MVMEIKGWGSTSPLMEFGDGDEDGRCGWKKIDEDET